MPAEHTKPSSRTALLPCGARITYRDIHSPELQERVRKLCNYSPIETTAQSIYILATEILLNWMDIEDDSGAAIPFTSQTAFKILAAEENEILLSQILQEIFAPTLQE